MRPELMTEAQFARHRKVSRQAVMYWKRRGNIIMKDRFVVVEASDQMLNDRMPVYRGGTCSPKVDT